MKKIFLTFLYSIFCVVSFAQTTINFESIIDSIDWEDATESDIIYMFKDNICKSKHVNEDMGGYYTNYSIKNISIGKYIIPQSDILIKRSNSKYKRISMIIPEDSPLWANFADEENHIVEIVKQKMGAIFSKTIDNITEKFQDITYTWNDNVTNPCKLKIWIVKNTKTFVIIIGNDISL